METLKDLKLNVQQWDDLNRAQLALQNMFDWLEKLDPENDAKLVSIVKKKVIELLNKIEKRFGEID